MSKGMTKEEAIKLFIAWIKKKLGIQSPSIWGYKYEYDYLKAKAETEGKQ